MDLRLIDAFRRDLPEFSSRDSYTAHAIEFWIRVAHQSFNLTRWAFTPPHEGERLEFMIAFAEEFGYSLAHQPSPVDPEAVELSERRHRHGDQGAIFELGFKMFIAHHLVLEQQAQQRAALGGPPGVQVGVITNVSVNGASVAYDTSSTDSGLDAGHWNMTTYGKRYIQLARMVGSGGLQL